VKQLVILSGKGGTGKTSVTVSFAHLASHDNRVRAILADADVDASNLELVLEPQVCESHDFAGGSVASIDPVMCNRCGICATTCRFDAIIYTPPQNGQPETYSVDEVACEGCAACYYQCPSQTIRLEEQIAGQWFRSDSRYGPLFHAALRPAQENSGKLVTLVKQQARLLGLDEGYDLVLVDGPPGIGCPVISAASGADIALVVAEPTNSGIHDLERVLQTTSHFRIPSLVCINKADIYPEGVERLEAYCREHDIPVVGHIPFDEELPKAMIQGEPITAWRPDSPVSRAIANVWDTVMMHLVGQVGEGVVEEGVSAHGR
jgi:MinD superfamily P-loop ATPase